jgi:hypothetical protein
VAAPPKSDASKLPSRRNCHKSDFGLSNLDTMNIPRNSHSSEVRLDYPNPFAEVDPKDSAPADEELASSALAGNKDSL